MATEVEAIDGRNLLRSLWSSLYYYQLHQASRYYFAVLLDIIVYQRNQTKNIKIQKKTLIYI